MIAPKRTTNTWVKDTGLSLRGAIIEFAGLGLALGLLLTIFGFTSPHFLTRESIATIANQAPAAVIIAVGMTLVLVTGGIDLSVGSVVGFSGAVLGVLMAHGHTSAPVGMAGCLAAGLACGWVNGQVSTRWKLPSFIVTLGMLEIARGLAHLVTGSQTQYIGSPVAWLADTSVLGLSLPFLLALVLVAGGQCMLSRTISGRHAIATGANEEALRLSGVDPDRVKRMVFTLSGVLAAVAAAIDTSRFQAADPNAGSGYELDAIAAVVIGGTSLSGGRGSVVGSFLGVLIIAVLGAGLAALGVKDETKRLVTGIVIVGAVILDRYRHRDR